MTQQDHSSAAPTEGAKTALREVFSDVGEFAASRAAEDWCAAHGISVGIMQRGDPRGLLYGNYVISKWRRFSAADISCLDGRMTGDMRNGPVVVEMIKEKGASA